MIAYFLAQAAAVDPPSPDLLTWSLKNVGAPGGLIILAVVLIRWVSPKVVDKLRLWESERAQNQRDILQGTKDLQKGQLAINDSQTTLTVALNNANAMANELVRNCERLHDKMQFADKHPRISA